MITGILTCLIFSILGSFTMLIILKHNEQRKNVKFNMSLVIGFLVRGLSYINGIHIESLLYDVKKRYIIINATLTNEGLAEIIINGLSLDCSINFLFELCQNYMSQKISDKNIDITVNIDDKKFVSNII